MGRGRATELTRTEREAVVRFLCARERDGKLLRGSMGAAAKFFGLHRNTVGTIWTRRGDLSNKKKGRVGRKKKHDISEVKSRMEEVEPRLRQTIRSTAAKVGIPKTTLWRMVKEKHFRRASSRIKPLLTPTHITKRLEFAMRFVGPELPLLFHDFYDRVHIDEKWFFIDLERKQFYLTKNEQAPRRSYQSKRHLLKVMFLVAVARPCFDHKKNQWFTGKIGLWPFTKTAPAQRSSKLRPKGAMITVPVSVTREEVKKKMLEDVIPSIKATWPSGRTLFVQQDNASPHCLTDDADLSAACNADGWHIQLECQPAQSPDFNVLDLGLFAAMQALQQTKQMRTVPEIVSAVQEAFQELSRETLDNTFLTLMSVMNSCLRDKGGNNFSISHVGKQQRRRQGESLRTLECDGDAYLASWIARYLN